MSGNKRRTCWLLGGVAGVVVVGAAFALWQWWRLSSATHALLDAVQDYERGEYVSASGHLQRSFEISPRASGRHLWRGAVLFHLDRPSEAVQEFEKELAEGPQENRASNGLGAALCAVGRYDEAIPPLKRVVGAYPYRPVYRHNLAIALEGAGRTREAEHEGAYARKFTKGASDRWRGPIVMEIDVGIR